MQIPKVTLQKLWLAEQIFCPKSNSCYRISQWELTLLMLEGMRRASARREHIEECSALEMDRILVVCLGSEGM